MAKDVARDNEALDVDSAEWPGRMGDLIRRYRLEKGWTQDELARRARCDQRMVSRLESGEQRHPDCRVMLALLVVLTVPRPFVAEALELDDYMDHAFTPDLDMVRMRKLYQRMVKLSAEDQLWVIDVVEQLVHKLRLLTDERAVRGLLHVLAAAAVGSRLFDLMDGRMDNVIKIIALIYGNRALG